MIEIIVGVFIVIFLGWLFYFRPINPSNKTDDQLLMMYRIAKSPRDTEALEAEMRKRGLMGSSDNPERRISEQPHQVQLQATKLRNDSIKAYDEGMKVAKEKWIGDTKKHHQHALTNVLVRRLQKEPNAPPISTEVIETLYFEIIPFNVLEPEVGKDAMVEYVVWREYPNLANLGLITNAINTAKERGLNKILADVNMENLSWLKWTELLNDGL